MSLAFKRYRAPVIATGAVVFVLAIWRLIDFPRSFEEAIFLHKLKASVSAEYSELNLAEMMPDDWELVCESQAYDGPLYLKRYDKTYPPAAPPQDGVWGFVFIAKDGSYRSAVGSCDSVGVHLDFEPHTCIERQNAKLSLDLSRRQPCATFSPAMTSTALSEPRP